jgi:hypothetical protein
METKRFHRFSTLDYVNEKVATILISHIFIISFSSTICNGFLSSWIRYRNILQAFDVLKFYYAVFSENKAT